VQEQTAPQHDETRDQTEPHARAGPEVSVLEGPLQEERDRDQDGDDADPGGPSRAEALLEEALAVTEELGEPAEPLRELARMAVRRKQ